MHFLSPFVGNCRPFHMSSPLHNKESWAISSRKTEFSLSEIPRTVLICRIRRVGREFSGPDYKVNVTFDIHNIAAVCSDGTSRKSWSDAWNAIKVGYVLPMQNESPQRTPLTTQRF